jgi:hypothetical protein
MKDALHGVFESNLGGVQSQNQPVGKDTADIIEPHNRHQSQRLSGNPAPFCGGKEDSVVSDL